MLVQLLYIHLLTQKKPACGHTLTRNAAMLQKPTAVNLQ